MTTSGIAPRGQDRYVSAISASGGIMTLTMNDGAVLSTPIVFPADVKIVSLVGAPTPGHYTAMLSDGSSFDVDLTAMDEQPATLAPLSVSGTGVVGTSNAYAREDHRHPLPVHTLTNPANALASTVDGVTATLAIPATTSALMPQSVGFNAAGSIVRAPALRLVRLVQTLTPGTNTLTHNLGLAIATNVMLQIGSTGATPQTTYVITAYAPNTITITKTGGTLTNANIIIIG